MRYEMCPISSNTERKQHQHTTSRATHRVETYAILSWYIVHPTTRGSSSRGEAAPPHAPHRSACDASHLLATTTHTDTNSQQHTHQASIQCTSSTTTCITITTCLTVSSPSHHPIPFPLSRTSFFCFFENSPNFLLFIEDPFFFLVSIVFRIFCDRIIYISLGSFKAT